MTSKLNADSFDIRKALEEDGVYAYGFGHIAKVAMLDRDLSCVAKGIYAYFCSFTSSKNAAYPKLNTILNDLNLNKRTYYKHFEQLIENGYITIKKAEGFKNKNVYVINEYVQKVNCGLTENDESESVFIVDGIKAHGYGTVPKLAMIDKRLTIKAKALMAFLLSLSGAGKCAFPRRDVICLQLGVSKNTYVSMMNELISCGYIRVTQRRTRNGMFAINDYHFEVNPIEKENTNECENLDVDNYTNVESNVEICGNSELSAVTFEKAATGVDSKNGLNSEFSPCPKNCTFLENGLNSELSPCPKNCTFLVEHRVPKNTPLPCPKNCTDNNINNNNNTVHLCKSILNRSNKVINDKLPEGNDLTIALHTMSNYAEYEKGSDAYAKRHCRVVKILIDIFSERPIKLYDSQMDAAELWKYFAYILSEKSHSVYPLVDFIYDLLAYYEQCASMYNIEHPSRYLRTLIIDKIISEYDGSVLS